MAKSSLSLGVVPPPPLSHVKMLLDERSFDAFMRYLLCACVNLVVFEVTTSCILPRQPLLAERLAYRPPQLSREAYVRSACGRESQSQV
jgi:hypothetical protein